jgi:uncharacterized metal-binding protein YceD (DUF177 family)
MNLMDQFRIQFGSLQNGEHEFEFEVDDKFFEHFENSIIRHGFVDVLVTVNKKDYMLAVDFTMDGTVAVQCDRCGENMDVEINGYDELTVKFGEENETEDDDVIIISPKENDLNVAQFIYEYATLLVPMRNVHPDQAGPNACNPETLKKLEALAPHEEEIKETDPRWDILKNINLN